MPINYDKLKGRIIEKCGTRGDFAKAMGLSARTVSLKLSGKIAWKQPEIVKAVEVLELESADIQAYFFDLKVQNL